jgi:hypothetical protein
MDNKLTSPPMFMPYRHTRNIPCKELNLYRGTRDMLEVALNAAMPLIEKGGLVCEFGVGGGRSMRMAQEILPLDATLHGFDTVCTSQFELPYLQ